MKKHNETYMKEVEKETFRRLKSVSTKDGSYDIVNVIRIMNGQ
jgi:hypothetical protein